MKPRRPGLTKEEIGSLSQAEFIITRLFGALGVSSFNEVMLSLPFDARASRYFRPIWTFITREVDLAMSELSLLYVVDRHPYDTVIDIDRVWPSRALKDLSKLRRS